MHGLHKHLSLMLFVSISSLDKYPKGNIYLCADTRTKPGADMGMPILCKFGGKQGPGKHALRF